MAIFKRVSLSLLPIVCLLFAKGIHSYCDYTVQNPKVPLKWGIATVGKISHEFVNALGTLDHDEHQVVAVAAREQYRADHFAKKFDIPKAYEGYLKLAQDPEIEAVYIGTITSQHKELAELMLEHGKSVLVEKTLCMNKKQAQELISFAEQKNVFLMEAIFTRFFPAYKHAMLSIKNGSLGNITSVEAHLGFDMTSIDAVMRKELGGGSLLSLGVYAIQLCQSVFQQVPTSINATGVLNDNGADLDMQAVITYGIGQVCKIRSSASTLLNNTAKIIGTKGEITLEDFWAPTSMIDFDGKVKTWPLPEAKFEFLLPHSSGLRYEAEEVRRCLRAGKQESDAMSHFESLEIAQIEDEIRKQIGVTLPEDD